METHLHPKEKTATIVGIRLGPGAKLEKTDLYDSASGTWEPCASPGLKVEPGCKTVWIRPKDLSDAAKDLLGYLMKTKFYITQTTHWKIIPSISSKYDTRMDWRVLNPGCLPELQTAGFIRPTSDDDDVYELTDAGREYGKQLVQ